MADGFLSALTRRAEDWREEAEAEGHRAGRRLRREREHARAELRRLWSQLEDVVERRIGPRAEEGWQEARGRASDYARAASEQARGYAEEGRARALDAAHALRAAARERPLLTIGLAVGLGLLVAGLVARGRR